MDMIQWKFGILKWTPVERGRILEAYRHATSADRPDYLQLCRRK